MTWTVFGPGLRLWRVVGRRCALLAIGHTSFLRLEPMTTPSRDSAAAVAKLSTSGSEGGGKPPDTVAKAESKGTGEDEGEVPERGQHGILDDVPETEDEPADEYGWDGDDDKAGGFGAVHKGAPLQRAAADRARVPQDKRHAARGPGVRLNDVALARQNGPGTVGGRMRDGARGVKLPQS